MNAHMYACVRYVVRHLYCSHAEEISISNASDTYVNIQIEGMYKCEVNDPVFSCGDGRPVEELLEEASECNSDI